MLHPGQVIDRYEVESVLGEGGMAVVYRVRHTTLGSLHALKVLTYGSRAVRERLLAEGRVQAGLDHPNALTVTDVVDVDGAPGLVMEFVQGGTLDEWVHADHPDRATRLAVFIDICEAVAEAHRRGWVHRDLKPGNVLIKHTAGRIVPKVADFGLVKALLGDQPLAAGRTREGVAMGTPGFMAPEQIADAATVDVRADVFSLGCVLVWLLTGEGPFAGDTPLQIFGNVAANVYVSLPETDPLHDLVERCLAQQPDGRFADAGALVQALRERTAPPPTPAPAPVVQAGTTSTATPAPTRPSRVAPTLFIGAMGALGVAVTGVCALGLLIGLSRGSGNGLKPCSLNGTARLGYVRIQANTQAPLGSTVTLSRRGAVIVAPQMKRPKAVCRLPRGTKIEVRERIKKGWLAVYRDSTTLP